MDVVQNLISELSDVTTIEVKREKDLGIATLARKDAVKKLKELVNIVITNSYTATKGHAETFE